MTLNKRNSHKELIPVILKDERQKKQIRSNVNVDCGWGRVLFANTYSDLSKALKDLKKEKSDQRDILFYLEDPHVALSFAPQDLFLDPSHTYRIWMNVYRPPSKIPQSYFIRRMQSKEDIKAMNKILAQSQMMQMNVTTAWKQRSDRRFIYLVAEDAKSGEIIGGVMGLDHSAVFKDPTKGSSLWSLAVKSDISHPRVGEFLTRNLIEHFKASGSAYLDLSVMHNNKGAIALYKKLGFKKMPIFCMKHKNEINEPLYIAPEQKENLNPYAKIIVDEARRRGISCESIDPKSGLMQLKFGGTKIYINESLSELTSSIGYFICNNKDVTLRLLQKNGFSVPRQHAVRHDKKDIDFLKEFKRIVVKPVKGEQGAGVSVDITDTRSMRSAIKRAEKIDTKVILEEFVEGMDLRFIVINYEFVAAALRKPARITGNGKDSIYDLVKAYDRRRYRATGGESEVKIDNETKKILKSLGYEPNDKLENGKTINIKKTANVHTGGTIEDVSDKVTDELKNKAVAAAKLLHLPVVGLDFIVKDFDKSIYYILEANERPGLANHEPQPTAEKYIDLLFPQTKRSIQRERH